MILKRKPNDKRASGTTGIKYWIKSKKKNVIEIGIRNGETGFTEII